MSQLEIWEPICYAREAGFQKCFLLFSVDRSSHVPELQFSTLAVGEELERSLRGRIFNLCESAPKMINKLSAPFQPAFLHLRRRGDLL